MRHKHGYRKLGRTSSHRAALLKNLAIAVIKYEKIETTLPKAKELRGFVEKLITKAGVGGDHAHKTVIVFVPSAKVIFSTVTFVSCNCTTKCYSICSSSSCIY